jgi:Protein of unknown function (DUF3179)
VIPAEATPQIARQARSVDSNGSGNRWYRYRVVSRRTMSVRFRWLTIAAALAATLAACAKDAPGSSEADVREPSPAGEAATPEPLVDPDQIISGGPPPDGIPPIDDPEFVPASEVSFLDDREPVLVVEVRDDARAYPLQILTWHEIVNDEIGGVPVTVTYCPLCNTGIAFERPTIDGQLLDFGTSGKLYNSNLLMYDRQTDTYWAQATGQAVVGELTGQQLTFVPARILSFQDFRTEHPDGPVLSQDTGHERPYGENPYAGYDRTDQPFLYTGDPDPRLPATSRVLGIARAGDIVAFPYDAVSAHAVNGWAVVMERVAGAPVAVFWKAGTASALDSAEIAEGRDIGAIAAYRVEAAGRVLTFEAREHGIIDLETGSVWSILGRAESGPLAGEHLVPELAIDSLWFDWAAFHPQTRIFGRA